MSRQSPYETYSDFLKRKLCDNSSRLGSGISLTPQCYDGKREYTCTVIYNEVERDTVTLCKKCRDNLRKDARRNRIGFKSQPY